MTNTGKKKRTKGQHIVPRFYLAQFVDTDGFVWTYDGQTGGVWSATPINTAVETNFYSVKGDDGQYLDDLETLLSEIEDKAAPLYLELLKGNIPTGQDRADLALFFATLFTRSPAQISATAELMGAMAQKTMDMTVANPKAFETSMDKFAAKTGTELSAEERKKLRDFILDKDGYSMNVNRQAGLPIVQAADKLWPIFFKMSWIVVDCQDQHLITSDNPVVQLVPPEDQHPIYGDGGLLNKRAVVTVPLSPRKLLEMGWTKLQEGGLLSVNKQRGRLYNKQRAGYSEQYLYSSVKDAGIQSLAKKYSDPGVRFSIDGAGKLANVKVKRKLQN